MLRPRLERHGRRHHRRIAFILAVRTSVGRWPSASRWNGQAQKPVPYPAALTLPLDPDAGRPGATNKAAELSNSCPRTAAGPAVASLSPARRVSETPGRFATAPFLLRHVVGGAF